MASAILAISPGWKVSGPNPIQIREPLMVVPMPGQQRQQQQDETDDHRGEGVAPQQPVVAQEG